MGYLGFILFVCQNEKNEKNTVLERKKNEKNIVPERKKNEKNLPPNVLCGMCVPSVFLGTTNISIKSSEIEWMRKFGGCWVVFIFLPVRPLKKDDAYSNFNGTKKNEKFKIVKGGVFNEMGKE